MRTAVIGSSDLELSKGSADFSGVNIVGDIRKELVRERVHDVFGERKGKGGEAAAFPL